MRLTEIEVNAPALEIHSPQGRSLLTLRTEGDTLQAFYEDGDLDQAAEKFVAAINQLMAVRKIPDTSTFCTHCGGSGLMAVEEKT